MQTKQGTDVCYTVQVAVEHTHQLLVEHDVTNDGTDQAQLAAMALRAKATLAIDRGEAVAEMGDYDGDEVKKCLDAEIVPYIAKPTTSANSKLGLFGKDDFLYDPQNDCYHCPAGQALTFRFETIEQGRHIRYYSTSACQGCPFKSQCTRNKGNRRITRWIHEQLLEEMQQRVTANPAKVKLRKSIVEHPFGTIKRWMDQGDFLTRGLANVRGDMSLTVLVYNLKRAINILGIQAWLTAVS
jgi:hypothetical protein